MISAALLLILSSAFFTLRLGSTGSFPRPLGAAEERECLERAAQGDEAARNRLVEHNLRLVAHIIKKYYTASCDQDDLISIGTIGLIKGVSSFNAGKGVRLADFEADAVCAACDPGVFPFQGKQIQVIHSVSFCFQIYNRLH